MPGLSGIIGNLIQSNQNKKAQDLANQANTYAMIYKMPDEQLYAANHDPQQMHAWALENLMHLGEKNVDKEHKQKIPVLGTMLSVLGGLRNLNPVPGAPKPYAGKAPERAGPPPREEDVEKYKLDKRLHQEQADATVATQVEKDMQGVAEVKQKNAWKADLDEADHDAALVKQGRMTQDQADERQRTRYGVGAKPDVKPAEALHFKLPTGKIMIVHPRPGGGFMDASGKTVTLPEGAEEIDKPGAEKPPSVAEENRQEVHGAYAQMIGKKPGDLTTAEQQKADQWSKEDPVTKKRVDINMRKGMKFLEAWAKAQDAEVKAADTKQAGVVIHNEVAREQAAANKDEPIPPGSPKYTIADKLGSGQLTMADFRTIYSYSRNAKTRENIFALATKLHPDFNPAKYEMAFQLAKNPKVQQQLASMQNVIQATPDMLRFSEEAARSGSTTINKVIRKGGYEFGGSNYSNLHLAVTAYADELSGALGFGSATDMSRQMGFSLTDPNLSAEKFAEGMKSVVLPFIERKKKTLLDQMGIYGEPGMNPAASRQNGAGGSTTTTTRPPLSSFEKK
jgi:hypothetical protein